MYFHNWEVYSLHQNQGEVITFQYITAILLHLELTYSNLLKMLAAAAMIGTVHYLQWCSVLVSIAPRGQKKMEPQTKGGMVLHTPHVPGRCSGITIEASFIIVPLPSQPCML